MKYARAKKIASDTGISVSTLWRWTKDGLLPQPIKLANRTVVWDVEAVEAAFEEMARKNANAANRKQVTTGSAA